MSGTFFLPGPTEVRPEVLAVMGRRMIPHRGPEMRAILERVHRRLPPLFGTARPVYVASGAGTAMMEAAVRCGTRARVLAIVHGAFGERFARIAEACGRAVTRLEAPPGQVVDPEEVATALEHGTYDAVTITHVETSTGAVADLAGIARAARSSGDVMLLVDAISSVGGMPVCTDEAALDAVVAASQKALALPPGLSFIACSARLLERARTIPDRGLYLDALRYDEFWQRGETAPTPAIPLVQALDAQLAHIDREGLDARFVRHRAMRAMVERWVDAMRASGLPVSFLAVPGVRAPTVSCLRWDGDAPRAVELAREHGYVIGGGYGALAPWTFRIGHMGDHSLAELEELLRALEAALVATRPASHAGAS